MIRRWFHFSCRILALAASLAPLSTAGGCALFHKDTWSLDRYRDERAVDVDHRLNSKEPIVKSPF